MFRYVILALMCSTVVGFMISLVIVGALAACCCGTKRRDRLFRLNDMAVFTGIGKRMEIKHPTAKGAFLQGEIATVLLKTGVNIYAIVTLEQTIRRNKLGPEEKDWGFGQVLALFLLLGPVAELLNIFLAKTDKDGEEEEEEGETDSEAGGGTNPRPALQGNQQLQLTQGTELTDLPSSLR